MFAAHVTIAPSGSVTNLRAGKVSCLHCPMYFAFDMTPNLIESIIATHQLKKLTSVPQAVRELEALVQKDAPWWQLADLKAHDKIYWVSYTAKQHELEPAFRLLVLKKNRAFFITSGYFNNDYYVLDTA